MSRRSIVSAAAFAVAICCAVTGRGATLVNDTWRDGSDAEPAAPVYSEIGIDGDLDGDLESAWYQGGDGTLDPTGAGGPLRGMFSAPDGGSSATWTTYFTPEAGPVTLAAAGQQLKVTWVFTPRNVNSGNTSQNFRFAVVNSPAASRLAANGAPGNSTYTGYAIFGNMGPTLGNSNPFQLREHDNNGALLSGSGDWLALNNGATNGNTGYASDTQYTLVWTFTRTAANELDVAATMSGGNVNGTGSMTASFLDATPNGGSFSFDTFAIRPSGANSTAETFDTSLFKVEYVVPEPATGSMMALMGLAALSLRRRK